MKERLLMLALAAGALVLVYLFFVPKPQPQSEQELVFPLSTEIRPDGLAAVWRWLGDQHIPEASLRYRYDRLPGLLPRPTGNLLIMTMPQRVPARQAELAALNQWVAAGNTLLVLAAIDDGPLWVVAGDALSREKLQALTGLDFPQSGLGAGVAAAAIVQTLKGVNGPSESVDITPRGEHPLLAQVRHVTARGTGASEKVEPGGRDEVLPLELAVRSSSEDPALWLIRRGAGQVIVSAAVTPFSNRAVALDDNAQLLSNIVAWSRGEGGTVVFDDVHQGAGAYYDAGAFFADPRLHHTLLWVLALWLAFVLGALPLRAAQRREALLDEGLYIEASAGYFAAVVPPGEAARRLIERFLEELRGRSGSGVAGGADAQAPALWERFDAHPQVSDEQRRTLHRWYEKACAGQRVDLARLQNLLAELRSILE